MNGTFYTILKSTSTMESTATAPAATATTTAPSTATTTTDGNTLADEFARAVIAGDQEKLKSFLPSDGNQDKLSGLLDAAATIDNTDQFLQEVSNNGGSSDLAKDLEAQLEKDFPSTSNGASSTYGHLPEIAKLDDEIKL